MLYQLSQMRQYNYSSFLETKELPLHQHVIAKYKVSTYYGDIGVGIINSNCNLKSSSNDYKTQLFKVLFDTGSSELWVPDKTCATDLCQIHNRFTSTCTYREFDEGGMRIRYMSGEVSGKLGKDTVIVADIVTPNQIIGLASRVDVPLLKFIEWDGIVGLAYPSQNSINQKIDPLFDKMMKMNTFKNRGEKNQFSYYIGHNTGSLVFGGVDVRYKRSANEEIQWVPITVEDYWTVSLYDVKIVDKFYRGDGSEFRFSENKTKMKFSSTIHNQNQNQNTPPICPDGCNTIVDTGTYLIYGPSKQFYPVMSKFNDLTCDDKEIMPNIMFTFMGKGDRLIEFVLTPDDYLLEFKEKGKTGCVLGFAMDEHDTGWTIGQTLLKPYMSIYDRDTDSIGFVRANMQPDNPPNTKAKHSSRFKQIIKDSIIDQSNIKYQ